MTNPLTIAVTGASGFVGRYVTRALMQRGHSVRALIWDHEKARRVLPTPKTGSLTLVRGDVNDPDRVDALLDGADACINLVGIIRETRSISSHGKPQTFQRIHVDATRVLVTRCEAVGVNRFLQMSALGVRDVGVSEYQRTKFEAEQIVRLSSLDWTIFRPSLIHGPDGEFVQNMKGWVTGQAAPYLFLPYFTRGVEDYRVPLGSVSRIDPVVQPVAVEDVAEAYALAVENPGAIGEVYNLAGPEALTWPQLLRCVRDNIPTASHNLEPWGIPANVAAVAAIMAGHLGVGQALPFDAGMARMGAEDSTASLDKAKADLGLETKPFRASFAAYAERV